LISSTNIKLQSGAVNVARLEVGSGSNIAGINSSDISGDITFWSGDTHANRASADFRVTADGALVAKNITATGSIKTSSAGSRVEIDSTNFFRAFTGTAKRVEIDNNSLSFFDGNEDQALTITGLIAGNSSLRSKSGTTVFGEVTIGAGSIVIKTNQFELFACNNFNNISGRNIIPDIDAVTVPPAATTGYDLGTEDLHWKDLYIGDGAIISGDPVSRTINKHWLPDATGTRQLGTATNEWKSLFLEDTNTTAMVEGELRYDSTTNTLHFHNGAIREVTLT